MLYKNTLKHCIYIFIIGLILAFSSSSKAQGCEVEILGVAKICPPASCTQLTANILTPDYIPSGYFWNNGAITSTTEVCFDPTATTTEVIYTIFVLPDACSATITVFLCREVPQIATPPANITIECNSALPPMIDLEWTDDCDGSGTVTGIDVSDGMTCPETITRTWSYTDMCGNTVTCDQTITVEITNCYPDEIFISDNPIESNSYHAASFISSNGTVTSGTEVIFTAGEFIELTTGFEVLIDAEFSTEIQACPVDLVEPNTPEE